MNKLIKLAALFAFLIFIFAGTVHAARTVIILNDLFVDFSVKSNNPYWINDSQVVHARGRINYEDDGRYILTNARAYYSILQSTYGKKLDEAWSRNVGGDFQKDVIEHYSQRPEINFSEDLDLRNYWKERKKQVFGKK